MFHALKVKSNITIHLISLCWKLTARRLHNCIVSLRGVNFPNCQNRQFIYYSLEDMYSIRLFIVHHMSITPPTVSMQTFVPLTNKSTTELDVYLSVRFTIRGIICTWFALCYALLWFNTSRLIHCYWGNNVIISVPVTHPGYICSLLIRIIN